MAAIRLGNGDLFIWSPIALTPALKVKGLYDPAGLPNQLGDSLKVGLDYG